MSLNNDAREHNERNLLGPHRKAAFANQIRNTAQRLEADETELIGYGWPYACDSWPNPKRRETQKTVIMFHSGGQSVVVQIWVEEIAPNASPSSISTESTTEV